MFFIIGFFVFCFSMMIITGIKQAKAKRNGVTEIPKKEENVVVVSEEKNTFDEEYLNSVVQKSISELCDFGMSKEDTEHFLDKLNLCSTEENYLFLIEKCQEKLVALRDERVKSLSAKLDAKAEKGANPDTIAMLKDCLESATKKEQLDRVEQHIAKLRASSQKAKAVPKPVPKKSTKTA